MSSSFVRGRLSSIRTRLYILVLLAVLPAFGVVLYSGLQQRQSGAESAREQARQTALLGSAHYGQYGAVATEALKLIAGSDPLRNGDTQSCEQFLQLLLGELLKAFSTTVGIGVADRSGAVWCSITSELVPPDVASRPWFQQTLQAGVPFTGGTPPDIITFTHPTQDATGATRGVVFINFATSMIDATTTPITLPPGAVLIGLDADGTVIFSRSEGAQPASAYPNQAMLTTFAEQVTGVVDTDGLDGQDRIVGFDAIGPEGRTSLTVAVGVPRSLAFAPADRLLRQNLLILGGVLVLALAVAWVGGDYFLVRRVRTLLNATRQIAAGDFAARARMGEGTGELERLGEAFDEMAATMQQHEERLRHQALHDDLTGLPNRALFLDRLERALQRPNHRHEPVAVLFLDLDNFKVINDSLGHAAGDELIRQMTVRIAATVRPGDTVARLGGDEFTVLLERVTDADHALEVARRLDVAIRRPVKLDQHTVTTAASIGIALGTPGAAAADDVIRDADTAMYRAKAMGKAQVCLYDPSMTAAAVHRLELEADMRRGLDQGEFFLHYQPIVELTSGRIREVEALVRWQHPSRGLISPAEFVPLAEETGLIVPLGRWVMATACRQAMSWQAVHPTEPPIVMGVNLSARQFTDPGLVSDVETVLRTTGLAPSSLKLEITESAAMENAETTIRTLHELCALGVHLAIDDFGTGYSSLSYLKRFPVDTLKVDRSFVDGLGADANDTAIVRSVVALAKTLGLAVTGEGIETTEQLEQLRELGCDRGQGFLLARPLAPEAVAGLLAAMPPEPAGANDIGSAAA